ncbi:DUF7230 family protein [Pseudogulbenkiania ferrooxidans]
MAKPPRTNPVAKFAQRLQRCATFTDRKKRARQGYAKHKKQAGSFTLPPFLLTWHLASATSPKSDSTRFLPGL